MASTKQKAEQLLGLAGIAVNGNGPADIQVRDERLYDRVLAGGSLALGESYMDGWWEAEHLDQFFTQLLSSCLQEKVWVNASLVLAAAAAATRNLQSRSRAFQVGEQHYDIGNDLYRPMLGNSMAYSCGYWKEATDLNDAQFAKFDLICRKTGLKPGHTVLDIGSGWGGFLKFAAEKYGVKGLGVTVSKEQAAFAAESCKGLPVEFRLQDYRELQGKFDRIVSVGMFEHVGPKNYRTFMETAGRLLQDDGLFLLHTIGSNGFPHVFESQDPWLNKYIFPNSFIPTVGHIAKAARGLFVMEDWHNFGAYYDTTLMAWWKNFNAAWPQFEKKYGERFYRMWKYYLLSCAGNFRSRNVQLWQVVFSKRGVSGGYQSIR